MYTISDLASLNPLQRFDPTGLRVPEGLSAHPRLVRSLDIDAERTFKDFVESSGLEAGFEAEEGDA